MAIFYCHRTIIIVNFHFSDTEDEENETREHRQSETVDMQRPSEVAEEQTASTVVPSDSEGKKEAKPLLQRDSESEWIAEEIILLTNRSIEELTRGVFGKPYTRRKRPADRKETAPKEQSKYLDEDFIWQCASGHPYILPLFAKFYNCKKFRHYYISKYLPMTNLRKLIRIHVVLQTKVARAITAQIMCAIQFLHSNDIFHRNVNSKNILIDLEGKAKLSNFRYAVNCKESRGLHGHFFYQAPEVLSGGIYDLTADWFSLGICLYEMVMNHTPIENHCMRLNIKFQNLDFYGKIVVLLNCTYYIPKVFPKDLKLALIELLQKDPIDRLGYKDDLKAFREHPFFRSVDWKKLEYGLLVADLPNRK
ncbi:hypothetical protein CDAR_186991 [Caerostris darwini]|uniref:Protein kinase domain-containing protein n=1 Tax=Caerostris darwini TaxID=1538125 RepID=A0AAV4S1M1_9ARAC|nr:hypothetical protein CDAR_186991 [Caerostris darwini]